MSKGIDRKLLVIIFLDLPRNQGQSQVFPNELTNPE